MLCELYHTAVTHDAVVILKICKYTCEIFTGVFADFQDDHGVMCQISMTHDAVVILKICKYKCENFRMKSENLHMCDVKSENLHMCGEIWNLAYVWRACVRENLHICGVHACVKICISLHVVPCDELQLSIHFQFVTRVLCWLCSLLNPCGGPDLPNNWTFRKRSVLRLGGIVCLCLNQSHSYWVWCMYVRILTSVYPNDCVRVKIRTHKFMNGLYMCVPTGFFTWTATGWRVLQRWFSIACPHWSKCPAILLARAVEWICEFFFIQFGIVLVCCSLDYGKACIHCRMSIMFDWRSCTF